MGYSVKNIKNPFKSLTKKDCVIWLCSIVVITVSYIASAQSDLLTLFAALIGVTSLILAAGGNVWSQILMIIFSILYGIISWRFRYFGEMITYLGMTLPMAVWSTVTWIKNPSQGDQSTVKIQKLSVRHGSALAFFVTVVTAALWYILYKLKTPNIVFSTISVATSFLAAALTMLRSSFYALAYAANDIVLIVLWISASLKDPSYIPVVVNFAIFLFNDMYGFVKWRKREIEQHRDQ